MREVNTYRLVATVHHQMYSKYLRLIFLLINKSFNPHIYTMSMTFGQLGIHGNILLACAYQ